MKCLFASIHNYKVNSDLLRATAVLINDNVIDNFANQFSYVYIQGSLETLSD